MIFIYPLARSSLATGPNMRVPTGSPLAARSTAEFSSNLTEVPSILWNSLAVLTTTAFITSPFLTLAWGMASLTVTTIMSPIRAYRLLEPPRTLMHKTFFAPLLSAIFNTVSVCIIFSPAHLFYSCLTHILVIVSPINHLKPLQSPILPALRSFSPAIFCSCSKADTLRS